MDNPFGALLRSRKFWIMVLDLVVSMVTYFVTKYSNPEAAKDVLFLIGSLQPVVLTVIGSIAYEDAAMKSNPALGQE